MQHIGQVTIVLADHTEITVQTTLEDQLATELAFRKNKSWGSLVDSQITTNSYMAWHAAQRTGQPVGSWTEFTTGPSAAIAVTPVDDEDDDEHADEDLEVDGLGEDIQAAASGSSLSS